MGVKPENTFVMSAGDVLEISKDDAKITGTVPSGSVLIDGLGVGDIGNVVLRDRRLLSQDGLFTVVIVLKKNTGELATEPEILSRGFVYVRGSEELIQDARNVAKNIAMQFKDAGRSEWSQIKNGVRNALKDYLYSKTRRTPMILPIIVEID